MRVFLKAVVAMIVAIVACGVVSPARGQGGAGEFVVEVNGQEKSVGGGIAHVDLPETNPLSPKTISVPSGQAEAMVSPFSEEMFLKIVNGGRASVESAANALHKFGGRKFAFVRQADVASISFDGYGINMTTGTDFVGGSFDGGTFFLPEGGTMTFADGSDPETFPANSFVFVGTEGIDDETFNDMFVTAPASGSTTCRSGYYACCGANINGQCRSKCIQEGRQPAGGRDQPVRCDHGGEGSVTCSCSDASITGIVLYELESGDE